MDRDHRRTPRYALKSMVPFRTPDSNERGRRNEDRALFILEELRNEGFFVRVRKASKKQNIRGRVDFFGTIVLDGENPAGVDIPIQAKSSFRQAKVEMYEAQSENRNPVFVIVNEAYSNATIKKYLKIDVDYYIHGKPYRLLHVEQAQL